MEHRVYGNGHMLEEQHGAVDHRPRRVPCGRGEAAVEVAGDGGGEVKDGPERHLRHGEADAARRKGESGGA